MVAAPLPSSNTFAVTRMTDAALLETAVGVSSKASRVGGVKSQSRPEDTWNPARARTGASGWSRAVLPALSLTASCCTIHSPQSALAGIGTSPYQVPESASSVPLNQMSADLEGL